MREMIKIDSTLVRTKIDKRNVIDGYFVNKIKISEISKANQISSEKL